MRSCSFILACTLELDFFLNEFLLNPENNLKDNLQGAIGSRIMEPVYCSGILLTTGDDTQSIKFNNFLRRILNNDILKQSAYLPGVFMPLRPCVINYHSVEHKLPERDDADNIECLEWCAQYSAKPHKVSFMNLEKNIQFYFAGLIS